MGPGRARDDPPDGRPDPNGRSDPDVPAPGTADRDAVVLDPEVLDAWGEDLGRILRRDGPACVWCSTPFGRLARPTREHVVPRVRGGPSWPENLVAACGRCNRERGTASPVQWLDELRARGRTPRAEVVEAALVALATRIRREGGARRARSALAPELRKLGRDPDLRG